MRLKLTAWPRAIRTGVTVQDEIHRRSGVDVIVRFHDLSRLSDLDRAIFSLVGQRHHPIRILLVLQRFDTEQQEQVRTALAPMLSFADGVELVLLNFAEDVPRDARAKLLNVGLAAATGRYLGILDYDDVLLPHAYRQLVDRLEATGAAIAFARTPVVKADRYDRSLHPIERSQPFEGHGLCDLLVGNFCPIHSYLVDRDRVPPRLLHFDPDLSVEEDYEFLIRLCAVVRSDFVLLGQDVGLYLQDAGRTHDVGPEAKRRTTRSQQFVDSRRRMTILAPEVQRILGIEVPAPDFTVQDWIDFIIKKGQSERNIESP